eukprot:TCONS_00058988-protein
MSWCRAVWLEPEGDGFKEFEMTIPRKWVIGKEVWYPKGMQVTNAFTRLDDPKTSWSRFPFVKFKLEAGDRDTCDAIADLTSAVETDDDRETRQKSKSNKGTKSRKQSNNNGIELSFDGQEGSPVKKKPDNFVVNHSPGNSSWSLPGASVGLLDNQKVREKPASPHFAITPCSYSSSPLHGACPSPLSGANACAPHGMFNDQTGAFSNNNSPKSSNKGGKSHKLFNNSSSQDSIKPKYRSGGSKTFKEMPNKDYQYNMMMELENIKQNQERMLSMLENSESHVESGGDIESLEPATSMDMFDAEEQNLSTREQRHAKRKVVRKLGGKNIRQAVRFALDALMSKEVQKKFSKDGRRGKRNFADTNHQKVITGALSAKFTKDKIVETTGDILKRAGDYIRRAEDKKRRLEEKATGSKNADEKSSSDEDS